MNNNSSKFDGIPNTELIQQMKEKSQQMLQLDNAIKEIEHEIFRRWGLK